MFLDLISLETVPLWAIAGALGLVYVPAGVVGLVRVRLGYDYSAPRSMFDKLPGYGQRATWAHANGFETFVGFMAAALMAYLTGPHVDPWYFGLSGDQGVAVLCATFLVARVFYNAAYIFDVPVGRSLAFVTGSTAVLGLLGISLWPGLSSSGLT